MDLIHTKIGPALRDASTWASITGALAAYATQAPPTWTPWICGLATITGIIGALLRGGQPTKE